MGEPHPAGPRRTRPEIEYDVLPAADIGAVERALSPLERIANVDWVRRATIIAALACTWEVYAHHLNNPLLLPTFSDTLRALWLAAVEGRLLSRVWSSLQVLLMGYTLGVLFAGALTSLAVST